MSRDVVAEMTDIAADRLVATGHNDSTGCYAGDPFPSTEQKYPMLNDRPVDNDRDDVLCTRFIAESVPH